MIPNRIEVQGVEAREERILPVQMSFSSHLLTVLILGGLGADNPNKLLPALVFPTTYSPHPL